MEYRWHETLVVLEMVVFVNFPDLKMRLAKKEVLVRKHWLDDHGSIYCLG